MPCMACCYRGYVVLCPVRYQAPGVGVNPLNVVDGAEASCCRMEVVGVSWSVSTIDPFIVPRLTFQSAVSPHVPTQSRRTCAPDQTASTRVECGEPLCLKPRLRLNSFAGPNDGQSVLVQDGRICTLANNQYDVPGLYAVGVDAPS